MMPSTMSTDRFVLGTAGHIDHGKTALVRAVTGTDTDRLKEEKARGITIELGFASLQRGDTVVGLVDVPGHERFIRAMTAGATGVDAVMLVVAADEGVMPQTREHLAVCSLLGVPAGFVALNKVDLVDDPEWLELVESDLRDTVAGTFLEDQPIVHCSAETGRGLAEIREAVFALTEAVPARQSDQLLRLPLDRVFTLTGHGTVVTGTLVGGALSVGQEVVAAPSDQRATVRSIQVHGSDVQRAEAGQRTAVNLRGVEHHRLSRGQVLVRPAVITPCRRFDARLRLLDWVEHPIRRGQSYIVLHGTAQAQAAVVPLEADRIEPGRSEWVQLQLDRPLLCLPGDRFVLQGFTLSRDHGSTIGGGLVVRSQPGRRRKRDPEYAARLARLAEAPPPQRVAEEVALAGMGGLPLSQLYQRVPFAPPQTRELVESLREQDTLLGREGALMHEAAFSRLRRLIVEVVAALQQAQPMAEKFGRAEVASRLGFPVAPALFALAVDDLIERGELEGDAEGVAPPGSAERQARKELAEQIRVEIEEAGLEPPRPPELAERHGMREADLRDLLAAQVKAGRLVRAKDDFVFGADTVARLQDQLVSYLKEHGEITPTEFKQMCGVTRKYLIPLAELFDERKVTLRVGDVRRLRR
jgi:selenocysteine-specific elongation factor